MADAAGEDDLAVAEDEWDPETGNPLPEVLGRWGERGLKLHRMKRDVAAIRYMTEMRTMRRQSVSERMETAGRCVLMLVCYAAALLTALELQGAAPGWAAAWIAAGSAAVWPYLPWGGGPDEAQRRRRRRLARSQERAWDVLRERMVAKAKARRASA